MLTNTQPALSSALAIFLSVPAQKTPDAGFAELLSATEPANNVEARADSPLSVGDATQSTPPDPARPRNKNSSPQDQLLSIALFPPVIALAVTAPSLSVPAAEMTTRMEDKPAEILLPYPTDLNRATRLL